METNSTQIGSLSGVGGIVAAVAGIVGCGLWLLGAAATASAESIRNTVEQRMEAGTAAIESAADMAEEPSPTAPETAPPASPSEQPAMQVQPAPVEQSLSTTTGDTGQPEGASQPEPSTEPSPEPSGPTSAEAPAAQEPAETTQNAPTASPAPSEAPVPAQVETAQAETPPAPPSYTVKPGDTLWSISSQHLSDPFNWPKLWNVNPTVDNPDLIFPGNVLMLPNGQPVEAVQTPPPPEEAPEETVTAQEEAPAFPAEEEEPPPAPEEHQVIAEQNLQEQEAPDFEVLAPPPTQSKDILIQSSGYIAKDLPVAARVVGTHENRVLLGDHDRVYLLTSSGTTLEENGRYTIYRRIERVVHPVSGRVVGDLIRILGEVEVTEVGPVSTGVIVNSFAAIEPGDDVMPARTVEAAPTTPVVEGAGGSLSGLILAVMDQQYLAGEFNVVYIDRGESSGVVVGDHLRVFRRGQLAPAYAPIANIQLPDRLVGEIEILSVQGKTATALLTRSTEPIALGDRIER
jgi:nucleoid-associated protein YgaU